MLIASRKKHALHHAVPAPLAGGISLLPEDPLPTFELAGDEHALGTKQVVPIDDQPFQTALRISTSTPAHTEWNIQARRATVAPIHAGDAIVASFWMRCADSTAGSGQAGFVVELPQIEWDKSVEMRIDVGNQWKHFVIPFRSPRTYRLGEAMVCFRVGLLRQTIEIGGVELMNYGKTTSAGDLPRTEITYAGRDSDADWRHEAIQRIEKLRKADLAVRVTDAAGKPVPGATVHLKMLRHAFGFGSAVAAEHLLGESPDNHRYREAFRSLFNRAVFENDMKWQQTWDGVPDRVEHAMHWLEQRRIPVRGHCLVWPSWRWLPRDLKHHVRSQVRRLCAAHCFDMVHRFKGRLGQWDVVNEAFANHDLMDLLGQEVLIEWFEQAHQADPACELYLNDYGIICNGGDDRAHQDSFYNTIRYLKDYGAPIHGIGIQSHFSLTLTPPPQLLRVLDRFCEFGLPIESTELSLTVTDRQLQADYLRDYMTALFSHPAVQGIMLWGFWEGRHWRADSALFTRDWHLRPHGQVWIDLTQHEWRTDVQLNADAAGLCCTRCFLGDYEITITTNNGRSQSLPTNLPPTGRELAVVLE